MWWKRCLLAPAWVNRYLLGRLADLVVTAWASFALVAAVGGYFVFMA